MRPGSWLSSLGGAGDADPIGERVSPDRVLDRRFFDRHHNDLASTKGLMDLSIECLGGKIRLQNPSAIKDGLSFIPFKDRIKSRLVDRGGVCHHE